MRQLSRFIAVLPLVFAVGCGPDASKTKVDTAEKAGKTAETVTPASKEAASPPMMPTMDPAMSRDHMGVGLSLEKMGCLVTYDDKGRATKVDCKAAELNDEQVEILKGLPDLVDLSLENSAVTNDGLKILEEMPQLKSLSLRRCAQVTDDGLVHLKALVNLERLLLLYTTVTDAGMVHLQPLTHLKLLDLRGCMQIGDGAMAQIKSLPELTDLKIRTNALTDQGLLELKDMDLTVFELEDAGKVTNAGIEALKGMTNLKKLNLMRIGVDDAALKNFENCKQLRDVRLRGTAVDGSGLVSLVGSKDTLTYLDLNETAFGSDAMANLVPFTNLETLELWFARITDDDLAQLAGMTKLKSLNLEQCTRVTSAGMDHLLKLPALEVLNLKQTRVEDEALDVLAKCSKLKELDLRNTSIGDEALEKFKAAKPDCKVIF